jgi:hypothetical protein
MYGNMPTISITRTDEPSIYSAYGISSTGNWCRAGCNKHSNHNKNRPEIFSGLTVSIV